MFLRAFLLLLGVISILSIAAPGSGGMASFSIIIVGWVIIDQLDDLIEIAGQSRDLNLAMAKRVQGKKGEEA